MKTKKYGAVAAAPYPTNDYQCEEDVRTLTRAAEVLGDRARMKMAMRKFKHTQVGVDKLVNVLSSRRVR